MGNQQAHSDHDREDHSDAYPYAIDWADVTPRMGNERKVARADGTRTQVEDDPGKEKNHCEPRINRHGNPAVQLN